MPRKRGRPSTRDDTPIKVPMPLSELVRGILKAGPHPESTAKKMVSAKRAKQAALGQRKRRTKR